MHEANQTAELSHLILTDWCGSKTGAEHGTSAYPVSHSGPVMLTSHVNLMRHHMHMTSQDAEVAAVTESLMSAALC